MSVPRTSFLPALLIVLAGCIAYSGTLEVPFLFDDISAIVDNPTIRHLWPVSVPLSPPPDWGITVSGRPILNLSFAVNYAVSGLHLWSYHVANLVIHLLAGLLLYALVRRTLQRPPLAEHFSQRSFDVALIVALLWTVHPLQVESVTYIVQRAESLMGLFFLLTLYGFVRSVESARPRRWMTVAATACLLGVGTKEVTALAPILVFLYDRTFVSGSFRAAWRRHRWRHLTLGATWLPLAWLVMSTGGNRGNTIGFDIGVSWADYWLIQFEAVTRYLWLSFWPHPLIFDYGKVAARGLWGTLPWAIPVLVLVPATLIALWRWPVAGFLGAWFFGILAPTSIIPGAQQMIVEHRMYLPLAAVIALVVGWLSLRLSRQFLLVGGTALAVAAGLVTLHRNTIYADEEQLWLDTIAKRPTNARAFNNLGRLYLLRDRPEEAVALHEESLRLDPSLAQTHFNLGLALDRSGRPEEAVAPLQEAVRILPYHFKAHLNLGIVLRKLSRAEEALPHFAATIAIDPSPADAHFQMGVALAQLERWPEAIQHYARAVELNPDHAEALSNWGNALVVIDALPEAITRYSEALRLRPGNADMHFNLGLALTAVDRRAEALQHYDEAVRLDPSHAEAQLNLGIAVGQQGDLARAIDHLERAVQLRPESAAAHTNLGVALSAAGRPAEALAAYEAALRLEPDDPRSHYNVGYALLENRQLREARSSFESALRLDPDFTPARDILRQLPPASP